MPQQFGDFFMPTDMSYLRTEFWENGDIKTPVNYYKCDITGDEICDNEPFYGDKDGKIHISDSAMEQLVYEWIKTRAMFFGGTSMVIEHLKYMFLDKKKPNRYIPKRVRDDLLRKYKHTCVKCGSRKDLEIDHIVPISRGGKSELMNLQVLCKQCNIKKSNKMP